MAEAQRIEDFHRFGEGAPATGYNKPMSTGSHHAHNNPKNTRREARELVLRMLYQLDSGKQSRSDVIDEAFSQSHLEGNNRAFATDIINGTLANIAEIDERLSCLTEDWAADRQAVVDRNVLRLGA